MRVLLDTHALVWWDNDELPAKVVERIQRAEQVYVSAASAWEIAIKAALGKIAVRSQIEDVISDYGFLELPILIRHTDALRTLPAHHRDPFDRLLVAQAGVENLVLITRDKTLARYKVPLAWD